MGPGTRGCHRVRSVGDPVRHVHLVVMMLAGSVRPLEPTSTCRAARSARTAAFGRGLRLMPRRQRASPERRASVMTREQPALQPADDAPGRGRPVRAYREVLCQFLDVLCT
jgi:hypothetical protein